MYKKRYLFLIMIICFFAISAVSAEEITNATSDFVSIGDNDSSMDYGTLELNSNATDISISELDHELLNYETNVGLLGDADRNSPLWYTSFSRLKEEIYNTGNGETLYLTNNYRYESDFANDYWTITITKNITIDGNGYTIDANGFNVFDVYSANVVLKNMKIINAYDATGGAISWYGHWGRCYNVEFINNSAATGGAIVWTGYGGIIDNCSFINNSAHSRTDNKGDVAAILMNGRYSCISNSKFINNVAEYKTASIELSSSNIINNCIFINNTAKWADVEFRGENNIINNSIFINDSIEHGGAIYVCSPNCIINKCNLSYNSNALTIGDFSSADNCTISNCFFNNNNQSFSINPENHVEIINSYFKNNGHGSYYVYPNETDTGDFYINNEEETSGGSFSLNDWEGRRIMDVNLNKYIGMLTPYIHITRTLTVTDVVKYYGGEEKFIVLVNDAKGFPVKNAEVNININGQNYVRTTNEFGEAFLSLNLNSGTYNVITKYGDITVDSLVKIKHTISANDFTKIFRNGTQYYANFTDSQGNLLANNDVKFNINGVFYTRCTDANGRAKMNINLNPGTYVITAENPVNGEKYSNTIIVLPNIVENHDLTKYYKNGSQYHVRLLGDGGKPVSDGVDVTFNINGVFYTRSTDANGYARMNINLGEGTYIITADYNGLKVSNIIKVLPILSANDLSMFYRDGSKFEAKLLDGHGEPFANQNVTFNINGVFYERLTDDGGVARLNINLVQGKYIVTSSYNGFNIANNVIIEPVVNPSNPRDNSSNSDSNGTNVIIEPVVNPSNPRDNSSNGGSNDINIDYNNVIIIDIGRYDKNMVKYNGSYKVEANVYQNSNTGIDISLSNNKISGTGDYSLVDKNYYTSSIYSNRTGTWQWSDWKVGEGVSGATFHRYSYWTNNFVVKKVAVKIIDGLSDDGYSFYPDCPAMPDVDSHGITREYAINHDMHYIQGSGDFPGGYVSYDLENGCYHA